MPQGLWPVQTTMTDHMRVELGINQGVCQRICHVSESGVCESNTLSPVRHRAQLAPDTSPDYERLHMSSGGLTCVVEHGGIHQVSQALPIL